jgi:hypothetical protein
MKTATGASFNRILADEINAEQPNSKVKATIETVASRNAVRNIRTGRPQ